MQPGTDVAGTARPVKQARPGVIVLIAFVVEVVAIGALANEVVAKHLASFVASHHDRFVGHLVGAFLTYEWRVSAQAGDRANEPLAHACLDLVVLALTALLVLAVCRGPVTFARAFLGTWMAVLAATLAGQFVFDLISPPPYPPGFGHFSGAVFTGPNGFGVMAGLMLGLVTAIFASIFAVATRRTVRPAGGYREPDRRDEYGGPPWGDQSDQSDQTMAYPRQDYATDYPQEYRQPYQEPSREPYGGYYTGRVGGGAPASAAGAGAAGAGIGAGAAAGLAAEPERSSGGDAEATQHLRTDPTQEPAAEPASELASEPASEPASESASEPASADAGDTRNEPTQAMAPPEPADSGAASDETRQFPRPPDDEDFGQHPDHHDL